MHPLALSCQLSSLGSLGSASQIGERRSVVTTTWALRRFVWLGLTPLNIIVILRAAFLRINECKSGLGHFDPLISARSAERPTWDRETPH